MSVQEEVWGGLVRIPVGGNDVVGREDDPGVRAPAQRVPFSGTGGAPDFRIAPRIQGELSPVLRDSCLRRHLVNGDGRECGEVKGNSIGF